MSKAIAVVEDDESIREMLRYYFQSVGYAVRAYESGEALFAGEEGLGLPALYILDIMLPGMDGLEILRRLREGRDTADVPVIMLTARSAEMDRVAGLENGADDYVVKPFETKEVIARIKAYIPLLGPVVMSSLTDAQERGMTLETRGFGITGVKQTSYVKVSWNAADKVLNWIFVLFLIAVVAVSVCIRIGVIPLPVSWGGK